MSSRHGYSDRSTLLYVGTEIERMGDELGVGEETMEDAIAICGDVLRSNYSYDSMDSVAAACLYLACKRQEEASSLPDIAEVARKPQGSIRGLGAKLMDELEIPPKPVDPDTYLKEGIEEFGFEDEQEQECFEILERAKDRNLHSGLPPTTVAGCILYSVAKKHRLDVKQSEVAGVVNKTTVCLRNNYREFLKVADDVPVDVLPPQDVESAVTMLDTHFEELPSVYAKEAKEMVNEKEVSNESSDAGVAAGAYLTVAERNDEDINSDEVSAAVGVKRQTVKGHKNKFEEDL